MVNSHAMAMSGMDHDDSESSGSDDGYKKQKGSSLAIIPLAIYIALCIYLWIHLHVFEGWDLVTCLYVLAQIVTTIGYGDLTPQTGHTRIIVSFFVMLTLVVFAYFLNMLVKKATDREEAILQTVLDSAGNLSEAHMTVRLERAQDGRKKLIIATAGFLAAVMFGTIFYAMYEDCSCSYGETMVKSCESKTYSLCVDTHGDTKSWIEAFYFSVITLTTVGFGDFTPVSRVGRWVGIIWMVLGVAATANWIGTMSWFFFEFSSEQNLIKQEEGDDLFMALDEDHDGSLSRAEHHLYLLRKQGIVQDSMLSALDKHFDTLDTDSSGKITSEQMHERPATF